MRNEPGSNANPQLYIALKSWFWVAELYIQNTSSVPALAVCAHCAMPMQWCKGFIFANRFLLGFPGYLSSFGKQVATTIFFSKQQSMLGLIKRIRNNTNLV
jgi:hypothetical protein